MPKFKEVIETIVDNYLAENPPVGGLTIEQIKSDTDIADSLTKKHSTGSDDQDLSGLEPKQTGKSLSTNDYTTIEKNKLSGIENNANNYSHPVSHAPSIITQDASNRFVTDTEKSTWNGKQDALISGTNIKTVNSQSLLGSGDIPIAGGSGSLRVVFAAPVLAALAWTNMPLALSFLFKTASVGDTITKADLTSYTQCRLLVNKQGVAGAAASKLILRYRTAFNQVVANYSDIGSSEVSVAVNVTNSFLATAWINLVAGAKADVFIAVLGSGGDGTVDPVFGSIVAEFK